jgi:ferritin-like metal-binding protein YciE
LLAELLWTERMLAFEVLPNLDRAVKSQKLAQTVREHLEETKEHATRLEEVFRAVGAEPSSNLFPPVEKLAAHHEELVGKIQDEVLADVYHAAAAATTEHVELASYDALLRVGATLELGDARKLLQQNRDEEARALVKLEDELERLVGDLGR